MTSWMSDVGTLARSRYSFVKMENFTSSPEMIQLRSFYLGRENRVTFWSKCNAVDLKIIGALSSDLAKIKNRLYWPIILTFKFAPKVHKMLLVEWMNYFTLKLCKQRIFHSVRKLVLFTLVSLVGLYRNINMTLDHLKVSWI